MGYMVYTPEITKHELDMLKSILESFNIKSFSNTIEVAKMFLDGVDKDATVTINTSA